MELVSALKKDVISNSLAPSMVKSEISEGIFVMDVKGVFSSEPKNNVLAPASASTSNPILQLFCYG